MRAIGFRQIHILNRCPDCFTVKDFAEANPHGVYVLGPHEHAVAVIDGDWWDSWDSGDTVPTYYFIKEESDHGVESTDVYADGISTADVPAIPANAATAGADESD